MRLCVLLVLLGAVGAACSGETASDGKAKAASKTTAEPTAPAGKRLSQDLPDQGRDIAWLRRLHRWELNLTQDAAKVGSVSQQIERGRREKKALRRPLVQLTRCEKNLLRQVREPAASRYRPGYDLLAEACRTLKGVSLTMIHSLDEGDPPPVAEIRRDSARSRRLFARGTARLEASLRANRALPVSRGSREESKVEPQLSRFVSKFVLHKRAGIEVRCWSKDEWRFVTKEWATYIGRGDLLGFVHSTRLRTSIAPRICRQLANLVYHDERPTTGEAMYRISEAVGILSHEAEHIRNKLRADEATTECHGMQRMRRLAVVLGADKSYADLLAESYWSALYEYNAPEYKSAKCRDGGRLDLRPGSDLWP